MFHSWHPTSGIPSVSARSLRNVQSVQTLRRYWNLVLPQNWSVPSILHCQLTRSAWVFWHHLLAWPISEPRERIRCRCVVSHIEIVHLDCSRRHTNQFSCVFHHESTQWLWPIQVQLVHPLLPRHSRPYSMPKAECSLHAVFHQKYSHSTCVLAVRLLRIHLLESGRLPKNGFAPVCVLLLRSVLSNRFGPFLPV